MLKNYLPSVEHMIKADNVAVGSGIPVNQLMEAVALLDGPKVSGATKGVLMRLVAKYVA